MDEQIYYSKQLAKTLLFAALALMIGVTAGYFLLKGSSLVLIMAAGIAFAGIPCGWEMADRVFGSDQDLNLLGLSLKLVAACVIGWAALPLRVVYCAAKCCTVCSEGVAYAG